MTSIIWPAANWPGWAENRDCQKVLYMTVTEQLIAAARTLAADSDKLRFAPPVTHVYNPLRYAWKGHEAYIRRFGATRKEVVFLGMNPGPFGMAQTGVPFGEISAVRDWMGISAEIGHPDREHPKRPILGFNCARSEISGKRLWKLFADRFDAAGQFFERHFVVNYCPLSFLEQSGCNRTPDKLTLTEKARLFPICETHLRSVVEILKPKWIIGIGAFAARQAAFVADEMAVQVGQILHPSPASPAANRDWARQATSQLQALGVWK
jgi:single-strand selective monofunctional uracil DNA glycosylase